MSKKSCPVKRTCEYLNLIVTACPCIGASETFMSGETCNSAEKGVCVPNCACTETSLKYEFGK